MMELTLVSRVLPSQHPQEEHRRPGARPAVNPSSQSWCTHLACHVPSATSLKTEEPGSGGRKPPPWTPRSTKTAASARERPSSGQKRRGEAGQPAKEAPWKR